MLILDGNYILQCPIKTMENTPLLIFSVTKEKSAVHTGQVRYWFICSFSPPESEKGYMSMVSDAFILGFPNLPYVDQTPVKTVYL